METLRQVLALPGFAPDDDLVVRISDAAIRRYSLTPFVEVNIKAAVRLFFC